MISLLDPGRIGTAKYFVDQWGANPSTVNFGQALVSHETAEGWWQYAAWYAPNNAAQLARKDPDGMWSTITLPFGLQVNDSHNSINLGVSASDGRLHVAAGQHVDPVQYTRSYAGFLDDGWDAWGPSTFEPPSGTLTGAAVGDLTYPTFTAKPDGGLLFWYRNGGSSNGRMRLAEYDGSGWTLVGDVTSSAGSWTAPNNGVVSTSRNFYWAHPAYDEAGRLHLAGTWNEGNPAVRQVPTAPVIQHHVVYVTSDDHGRTWRDSAGTQVATTDGDPIDVNKPGIHVPASTTDTRYALLVPDLALGPGGLVGVLADYVSPDLLTNNPKHVVDMDHRVQYAGNHPRWRNPGGTWGAQSVKVDGQFVFNRYPAGRRAATRGKIVFGPTGAMHVIHSGVRICSASAASGYTDWDITFRGDRYLYAFGEMGGIDRSRPDRFSVLYIEQAAAGATSSAVCVRDFLLES